MLVALDMFGTLADTASVISELTPCCGDLAGDVARTWRDRQLEHMFRVTAMGHFPPFADLTRWSLTRALAETRITLARPSRTPWPAPTGICWPRLVLSRRRRCWCPPTPSTSPEPVPPECAPHGASATQTPCSTPGDHDPIM